MRKEARIKSFSDLIAWQKGHELALLIYKITEKFPQKETFSLTDQLRRATTSVTSNVAEGFARKSDKEKIHFYHISLGSITELQSQFILAKDLNYISETEFIKVKDLSGEVSRLIGGLVKYLKTS